MPHSKGMSTQETPLNHSNIVPQSKSKASNSLDPGIERFKASDTLDTRIESKVLPSSPPLSSWADEADKDEATLTTPKKTSSPDQENMGIVESTTTSPPIKEVWTIVGKKKNTSSVTQPMMTRSRSRNKI
jgi:hypothetical protein